MVGFGFFAPFPLALMLPFMAAQSMLMGDAFGKSFQYGKRKISAMSNEDFNKLSAKDLGHEIATDYKDIIPEIQAAMQDSRDFQRVVIKEIGNIIIDLSDEIFRFLGLDPHFFHPDTPPGDIPGGITPPEEKPPEETGKLHLTLSEISAASDAVLLSWIQNINDYDAQTQQWLINERERRKGSPEPEPPSPPQEETKLDPEFVGTLTQSDLQIGGSRTRNYKGKIQKWKGTNNLTYNYNLDQLTNFEWSGSWVQKWKKGGLNQVAADAKVNAMKRNIGSSYVITFKKSTHEKYYLISDDF